MLVDQGFKSASPTLSYVLLVFAGLHASAVAYSLNRPTEMDPNTVL